MKIPEKFELIECRGTPYEIGYQWGDGCRESIHEILQNSFNTLNQLCNISNSEAISNAMKFLPILREFDPYLVEIMCGQSDASGLKLEEILLQKCMNELMFYTGRISSLCTAFAATGDATAGGKTIMGQNIDWAAGAVINLLKIYHSDGLVQYTLSFNNSSEYTFSSSGFGNCANATIGLDYTFGLPIGCYLPKAMRQRTVDEAMDILRSTARGLGYYHLADKTGHILGIESVSDDFEILYPHNDILLHSNHYLTERFEKNDTAKSYQPDSYLRMERISDLVNEHYGKLTPEILMDIMSDHAGYRESICRHVNETLPLSSETIASFIMVPEDATIYIACGNPCRYEYIPYRF